MASDPCANGLRAASTRARRWRGAVVGLLLLHATLLAWAATRHSPTYDEPAHLAAGVSVWQCRRLDLYPVNPPLVHLLAALPVVCARPHTDWRNAFLPQDSRPEFQVGWDFIEANPERWFWYLMLARWACIPLSLLGGYICWRWAGELYGARAGLVALALWCFCPNVLTWAQMITMDAGAAALGVTAAYTFWRWLRSPTGGRAVLAGVTLGLAELTKMTWVVLFLLWPLLWIGDRVLRRDGEPRRLWRVEGIRLAVILSLGLGVLHLGYGFDGSFQRLDSYHFFSQALTGQDQDASAGIAEDVSWLPAGASRNRFAGSWLGALPVPLPRSYLRGIDLQKVDFERPSQPSYLRGEWRRGGWWYYYLYALAVKVPLGSWLLLLVALALKLGRAGPPVSWRDELVVLAPLVVVLVLVSSQTGMNRYLRYVLPCLPFAYIWAAQAAQARVRGWALSGVVAGALGWSIASSLAVYPHSLSYFNELAGGPTNGHAHLVDANIDWGQDLFYLKRWLDQHPEARPVGAACFSSIPLSLAGIESEEVPSQPRSRGNQTKAGGGNGEGPRPGWYAVSVHLLRGADREARYTYFLRFRPVAMAGYSIYIYHLSRDDANRARRDLGLPGLPGP